MKKICFAVLVHEKREIVDELLNNIKKYCPRSSIVLFNGGSNKDLLNGIQYPVCPASRKLQYGNLAFFLLEVMKWLHQINFQYDYLVSIDSDVLFAKYGYEQFLINHMKDKDFSGLAPRPAPAWNHPTITMQQEWHKWKPIYEMDEFYFCFNVGQVFSKELVKRILDFPKLSEIERNLYETKTFAAEEIIYVTLAKKFGCVMGAYPKGLARSIRYRPHFTAEDVQSTLHQYSHSYLFHPIYRDLQDEARTFIRNLP